MTVDVGMLTTEPLVGSEFANTLVSVLVRVTGIAIVDAMMISGCVIDEVRMAVLN